MASLENKLIYKKKVDKDLNVTVFKNDAAERIFVEFSSKDGKLVLQRMFQDTYRGRLEATDFESSFESIAQFKAHFARRNK